jgi:hypothetical protein
VTEYPEETKAEEASKVGLSEIAGIFECLLMRLGFIL